VERLFPAWLGRDGTGALKSGVEGPEGQNHRMARAIREKVPIPRLQKWSSAPRAGCAIGTADPYIRDPVRIDLAGADTASASGRSPALKLCRMLVAAGHDPDEPAEVYRGSTLRLRIRSIGEAAKLTVKEDPSTRFALYMPFPGGAYSRLTGYGVWPNPPG
jgi:hypothetical protein